MTPALAQLALVVVVAAIAVSAAELPVPHREPPREPPRDDALSREWESLVHAQWVRAGLNTNRPTWCLRGGLVWGLPPVRGPSPDGPRGLIRLHYPLLPGGEYDLINFIAIENFEMRERFRPGQLVVFGITHRTPARIFQRVVDIADPVPSRVETLRAGAASMRDDASASR